MADLNIKNAEAHRLAKELAAATGESLTAAVTEALRERLGRIQGERNGTVAARAARIMELGKLLHDGAPPGYWDQDFDELLYDDLGLPR